MGYERSPYLCPLGEKINFGIRGGEESSKCTIYIIYLDSLWFRYADMTDMVLPLDIVLQTLLALLLTMFGVIHIAGDFKVSLVFSAEIRN